MCSNRNGILGSLKYSSHKASAAVYSLLAYCLSYEFIMFETLKYRVKQSHLQWSRVPITAPPQPWVASLAYITPAIFTQSHENCWNCAFAPARQSTLFNRHGLKANWLFKGKQAAPQKLLEILSSGISLSCWPYLQIPWKIQHHNIDV